MSPRLPRASTYGAEAALATFEPAIVVVSWMPAGVDWTAAARATASVRACVPLLAPPTLHSCATVTLRVVLTSAPYVPNEARYVLLTLHCSLQFHSIPFYFIQFHYIILHYITLHYIPLHYITLHYNARYLLLGPPDGSESGDAWATWGAVPPLGCARCGGDPDGCERCDHGIEPGARPPHANDGFVRAPLDGVARWQVCRFDSAAARGFSSAVEFTRTEGSLTAGR